MRYPERNFTLEGWKRAEILRVAGMRQFWQASGVPKLLKVECDEFSRPNFTSIVKRMLKDGLDVQLASKSHVNSLWQAITRAGYWSWSYRISDDAWLVRLSKTPASERENPLVKEYQRTFEPEHRPWRKLVPDLLKGKVVTLPTKEEATRFAISVRYHMKKEKMPAAKVTVTPEGEGFAVKLVTKD